MDDYLFLPTEVEQVLDGLVHVPLQVLDPAAALTKFSNLRSLEGVSCRLTVGESMASQVLVSKEKLS
jgi:hypothetical protein